MSLDSTLMREDLGRRFRAAIDWGKPYGATLSDVHAAMARELGRTSAKLPNEASMSAWMLDFARAAIEAYREERSAIADEGGT